MFGRRGGRDHRPGDGPLYVRILIHFSPKDPVSNPYLHPPYILT